MQYTDHGSSAKLVQYYGVSSPHSNAKVTEILKTDLPLLCKLHNSGKLHNLIIKFDIQENQAVKNSQDRLSSLFSLKINLRNNKNDLR